MMLLYTVWLNNTLYLSHGIAIGNGSSCQQELDSKKIAKGKWVHYVGIVDRVRHLQSIYINGVLNAKVTDNSNSFNGNTADLRIGFSEEGSWQSPFKGALDEIRLYNRALTAAEISSLYNQGVSVNGTVKSLGSHTVTCLNVTTNQSITIPTSTATTYNCEAKGLVVKPKDVVTITINGSVQ
jgi:hypothetical protein